MRTPNWPHDFHALISYRFSIGYLLRSVTSGSDLSSAALILKAAGLHWYVQTERAPCLGPLSVHRFWEVFKTYLARLGNSVSRRGRSLRGLLYPLSRSTLVRIVIQLYGKYPVTVINYNNLFFLQFEAHSPFSTNSWPLYI